MSASTPTTSERRAAASHRNGARSKGPRTAAGKARSSRNALKHSLATRRMVLLGDEDPAEFEALARAFRAELEPEGVLQAWRSGATTNIGPGSQPRWSLGSRSRHGVRAAPRGAQG